MKNNRTFLIITLLIVSVVAAGAFTYARLTQVAEASSIVEEEPAPPTEEPVMTQPEEAVETIAVPPPTEEIDESDRIVIVIDPGHGADDYGAPVKGVLEKNLVLNISTMLSDILSYSPQVKTYMTRTDDSYPSRDERVEFARDVNAAFMVSIHCNSNDSPDINGTETYYGEDAEEIAKVLHETLIAEIESRDRNPRLDSGYYIIRTSYVPTMIMEVGYLTNTMEFEKLSTEEYQHKIAVGIADGILKVVENMKE